jgi:hypothetical protein
MINKNNFILYICLYFLGSISSNCSDSSSRGDESEVGARKFSEAVVQTLSSVASVLEYPKSN